MAHLPPSPGDRAASRLPGGETGSYTSCRCAISHSASALLHGKVPSSRQETAANDSQRPEKSAIFPAMPFLGNILFPLSFLDRRFPIMSCFLTFLHVAPLCGSYFWAGAYREIICRQQALPERVYPCSDCILKGTARFSCIKGKREEREKCVMRRRISPLVSHTKSATNNNLERTLALFK